MPTDIRMESVMHIIIITVMYKYLDGLFSIIKQRELECMKFSSYIILRRTVTMTTESGRTYESTVKVTAVVLWCQNVGFNVVMVACLRYVISRSNNIVVK